MISPSDAPTTLAHLPGDVIRELFEALADVDLPRTAAGSNTFAYSSNGGEQGSSLGWIKLTHVCRRLRHIGLNLSTIWGRVVCIFPRAWETTLARSGDAPLDLYLGDSGLNAFSHWPISADALLARARYISDVCPEQLDNRRWWTDTSLPSLKVLRLDAKYGDQGPMFVLKWGPIIAPALVSYHIHHGFIPFHSPSLLRLTISHPVVWTTLLDSLRTCPLLEILVLNATCGPTEPVQHAVNPVRLMHLTTFRVTMPSKTSLLGFMDYLSIPAATAPQVDDCLSSSLFRCLLERLYRSSCPHDMLIVSAARPFFNTAYISCKVTVMKSTHSSFQGYRAHPTSGITALQTSHFHTFDTVVCSMLDSIFVPPVSTAIRTIAFHSDISTSEEEDDYPDAELQLQQLGHYMHSFQGVETIYLQRESIPILMVCRDVEDGANKVLFPELDTIILDTFTGMLDVSTWDGFVDFLMRRKTDGHPLKRLVLMGSHLCHLSTDSDTDDMSKLKLDLRPVKGSVSEIVDLRDTKECACDIV